VNAALQPFLASNIGYLPSIVENGCMEFDIQAKQKKLDYTTSTIIAPWQTFTKAAVVQGYPATHRANEVFGIEFPSDILLALEFTNQLNSESGKVLL
jgi:hypothetical protein